MISVHLLIQNSSEAHETMIANYCTSAVLTLSNRIKEIATSIVFDRIESSSLTICSRIFLINCHLQWDSWQTVQG